MQPVLTPTPGVSPRDSLATSMFAAPGVYAFLVGSGLSSAAGILTGERIVLDLIRMVAVNRGIDPDELGDDPIEWWARQSDTLPRYDDLFAALARSDGARQAILRPYFQRRSDTGDPVEPTAAHQALAALCKAGYVRVILTTNFDDLLERSLMAAGLSPQVLSSEAAVRARLPLAHAEVTIVKLHGDWRTLGLRNTPIELAKYARTQRALLRQVFDEYGLVVVGWSGEWEAALAAEMEGTPTRRYPSYWAHYGDQVTDTARHLITTRSACEVTTTGADEFLSDLAQRIDRLAGIATRRRGAAFQGTYLFQPDDAITAGWSAIPLLVLRTTALAQPVPAGTVGLIGPAQRARILDALGSSPIHRLLADLNLLVPASAAPEQPATEPGPDASSSSPLLAAPLVQWAPPEGARQSVDQARYRLGGDATVGVSALADVRLPHLPGYGQGDGALFILDIGISLEAKLDPMTIAAVLRDGLLLVTNFLPAPIVELLPPDATVVRCDCHLVASRNDGRGAWRANTLEDRIDTQSFRRFGVPNPVLDCSLGFGALISGPLTDIGAAEIVAEGLNYVALASGYLDPTIAIDQIRGSLGVPAAP